MITKQIAIKKVHEKVAEPQYIYRPYLKDGLLRAYLEGLTDKILS